MHGNNMFSSPLRGFYNSTCFNGLFFGTEYKFSSPLRGFYNSTRNYGSSLRAGTFSSPLRGFYNSTMDSISINIFVINRFRPLYGVSTILQYNQRTNQAPNFRFSSPLRGFYNSTIPSVLTDTYTKFSSPLRGFYNSTNMRKNN